MLKPIAFASSGGLARLARACNPEEFITVGAGPGGAFTEPLFSQAPDDTGTAEVLALVAELVRNHPTRLRTLWVDGRPVGELLVEHFNATPASAVR